MSTTKVAVVSESVKIALSLQYFREKFNIQENDTVLKEECGLKVNDSLFLRYLNARKFNNEKAYEMLQHTIQWRKDFGLKALNDGSWKDVMKVENATGKCYVRGFDKDGHAILYMKPRYENTSNHDGNLKHLVYHLEKAVTAMDTAGKGVEKLVLIIDYEGFSLMNAPPMKTSIATLNILQDHYPERLFRAYLVQPPWIFSASWAVLSPLIDPVTKSKIVMLNGTKEVNRDIMLQAIDVDVLEASFGGTDNRPFDSTKYLDAPFDQDFKTILDQQGKSQDDNNIQKPAGTSSAVTEVNSAETSTKDIIIENAK